MQPAQTAATYDLIGHHWNEPGFNRANGMTQHERALRFTATPGPALDVGCGCTGRFLDLLLTHGFTPQGLDLSAETLRLARLRHPQVVFHQADIVTWSPPQTYAFISAWDSVWHVPLADQLGVIRKLCHALAPGGVLIFTTGAVPVPAEITNPCHGQPLYHAAPGLPALFHAITEAACHLRHFEHDQHPELHTYLIVQKSP